eukprot:scaffold1142_cov66-Cylindrotheca_fusiformis.AAC.1
MENSESTREHQARLNRARARRTQAQDPARQERGRRRQGNDQARQAEEQARQERQRRLQAEEQARQDRQRRRQAEEQARQAEEQARQDRQRRLQAEEQARQAEEQARQDRQKAEQARQERQRRRQAEQKAALTSGEFYSKVADVWICGKECEKAKFSKGILDAVRRRRDIHPFYKASVEAAYGTNPIPADTSSRSSGSTCSNGASTGERKKRLDNVRIDGTKGVAQIAHLIPHSRTCAPFFGPLAEAAAGINLDADFGNEISPGSEKRRMTLVHGHKRKEESKRVVNTGIKHDLLNKARIRGQAIYFDSTPSLLLIPILTLEETLAYPTGTTTAQYEVLVACTHPDAYRFCDLIKDYEETCTQED